jgi:FKBP-type peptidyl-prolyl cis-trans isomerase (trigger factor)
MTDVVFEELERGPARRVYKVLISTERVSHLTSARLREIAQSVRLPGFRPGKIPDSVLAARYGAKARGEALQRLAAEAMDRVLARNELAASIDLVADAGDIEFRLAVTHLPELEPIDFASIQLERLSPPDENHLRQQVLDFLDKQYQFPVAPALQAREYARMIQEAGPDLTAGERQEFSGELHRIAERRVRLGAVVAEMARRYEVVPADEKIANEQENDRLQEERLITLIVSKAQVTERVATPEDLE